MEHSASISRSIRRLYRLAQKYSMARMEHPELTPSELQVLRHVGFHGEVSQRHLAEDMNVDKAMVSRILQKLEKWDIWSAGKMNMTPDPRKSPPCRRPGRFT